MIEDWPERMNAVIEEARDKPFAWGEHDCCLFAADVVQAITGKDYAKEYRGKYKTMRGAYKLLKKKPLAKVLDSRFKRTPFPNRGDVVLIPGSMVGSVQDALGICIGVKVALVSEGGGLDFMPYGGDMKAWSVRNG